MKFFTILFLIATLGYSPTVLASEKISVYLLPKHKTYIGFNENNYNYVELLDNDGNLYITFWDINQSALSGFHNTVKRCRDNITDKRLFKNPQNVSDINTDSIKPSLFKHFNLCIREKGYTHKYSDAFYPGTYQLSLYRGHSSTGNYMPVGSSFNITRKDSDYKRVIHDVRKCIDTTNRITKNKSYEVNSSFYSSVNIEPFANSIDTCLRKSGYSVTPLKNTQPEKAIEAVRNKDSHRDDLHNAIGRIP